MRKKIELISEHMESTIMELMDNAIAAIDNNEGDGFAYEHPELIHAYMDSAIKLYELTLKHDVSLN